MDVNSGSPYYSPYPYPVGTPDPAPDAQVALTPAQYISQILQPAVDFITSKGMYAIIDYHQIDNATTDAGTASQSGQDAVTFWTQLAPVFSNYPNVIYEAFNEPIDTGAVSGSSWSQTFTTVAQSWVNAIRSGAPNNLIIVGSPSWSQYPAGATLTGGNIAFSAHTYPSNFPGTKNAFQNRVVAAAQQAPVFITEWGYQIGTPSLYGGGGSLDTPDAAWASNLQSMVEDGGESWTAWVADPSWGPPMFATGGGLTDFGTFVQTWLANDADAGWVQ
jgi:aryl-phospho-beta-D-glucosidase BglC (GH1 family)